MGRDISIAIVAQDRYTDTITTIRNANQAFNKDLSGTMQKLEEYEKVQLHLKSSTKELEKELKEAEKQFKKTGDAADQDAWEKANERYKNAQRNLSLVSKEAKTAQREIDNMTGAISKAENRAGSSGSGGSESTMMKTLANAGLFKMAGDSLSGLAGVAVSSALGNTIGGAIQSTLSGAATGAAMGSLAGLPGMAIGAGVGALAGGVNAATSVFSSRDDAFKSAVQDSYNTVKSDEQSTMDNGVTIAGSREQTQLAFAQRFGSDKAAEEYLEKTKTMAKETNYAFDEITGYSKSLLNSYKPDQVFGILNTLSDASAGLNLAPSDVNMFISGLSRMRTTGKATQEYLNYFSERGVDVYKALGNDLGVDKSKIAGMVTKGDISGDTAAQAILDYIDKTYGGLSKKLSTTYDAMVDNLKDSQDDVDAAMGEGFTESRKSGIKAQQEWLSGDSGTKMSDAYSMIGSWKAELENTREKMIRSAMDKAMNEDPAYQKAKSENDRAEMGRILAKAQVDGENAYRKTEGYQQQVDSEKALVSDIRNSMIQDGVYKSYGYDMGQEFTKGLAAAQADMYAALAPPRISQQEKAEAEKSLAASARPGAGGMVGYGGSRGQAPALDQYPGRTPAGKAFGMNYIPYDNFPALLHEGERVLTASEARTEKKVIPGIKVEITGPVTVRQDKDIDDIAQQLFSKLIKAFDLA